MYKKIIIGILLVTVLGAAGAAYAYQAGQDVETVSAASAPLASSLSGNDQSQNGQADTAGSNPLAAGLEGEPWQATGTILNLDDNGFELVLENGETAYVELGPTDYWQAQDAVLLPGAQVTVEGTINDGMVHAIQVTLADDSTLQLRTESGQPLWSGGVTNGRGQNAGQADGSHTPDPQAQVDEWITVEGTLMSFQGGNMTVSTAQGELLTFQTGQPRFFASQGITFQVGDQVTVVGFYEDGQFKAGDITQVSTGLRVILRDPNGRPLWAGPGNGNGNGGGNAGRYNQGAG